MFKNLEIVDKNVDLNLLSEKIHDFLKNNNNVYEYSTFKVESLPDGNGFKILIDYGYDSLSVPLSVVVEGKPDKFRIYEYEQYVGVPYVYDANAKMEVQYDFNELVFRTKLWAFIENTIRLLENSLKK